MAQTIGFYIGPEHEMLDLAGPLGVFEAASRIAGQPLYDLVVVSREGGAVLGSAGVPIVTAIASGTAIDTLIVVGGEIARMLEPLAVEAVRALVDEATRIASVCTGAFLLAEAGILDGRRATTHWRAVRWLQERYPSVKVEKDRIFIADGNVWSSAGIAAGIDLALALIEADQGIELSHKVARHLVVYHRRPGGLSQFSAMSQMEPTSDRIRIALTFARERLAERLPIERLAEVASLPAATSRPLWFRLPDSESAAQTAARHRGETFRAAAGTKGSKRR